jgi:tRNA pseudouridine38-40 synthase
MSRFKVYLEYEGTRYRGWQFQKNVRTVQGELLKAAGAVFKTESVEFYGSGRTDAGVHALLQVAHLDVHTVLAPEIIKIKLNDELPHDISIIEVERASDGFHARHDAVARSYLYQIARRRTAFGKRFVWWIKDPLDIAEIRKAAALFVGMKDFKSFTAAEPDEQSTKVLIDECLIEEAGELILIRITGSHFIWKMVRQVVGVLAEVGRGKMRASVVENLLHTHSAVPARLTAPPSGLFLERVYYEGDRRLSGLHPVLPVLTKQDFCIDVNTTQKMKRRRYEKHKRY